MSWRRGYRAEMELMEMLRKESFYTARVPVSGGRGIPCDVMAAKEGDRRGYQVKETKADRVYIGEEEVGLFLDFCKAFGLKPFIAVRWKFRREKVWTIVEVKEAGRICIKYGEFD